MTNDKDFIWEWTDKLVDECVYSILTGKPDTNIRSVSDFKEYKNRESKKNKEQPITVLEFINTYTAEYVVRLSDKLPSDKKNKVIKAIEKALNEPVPTPVVIDVVDEHGNKFAIVRKESMLHLENSSVYNCYNDGYFGYIEDNIFYPSKFRKNRTCTINYFNHDLNTNTNEQPKTQPQEDKVLFTKAIDFIIPEYIKIKQEYYKTGGEFEKKLNEIKELLNKKLHN